MEDVDIQTIERALDGDAEAFEAVIRQYARLVYAQAYRIVGNRAEAEDIVQDTFLRAHSFGIEVREPAKFQRWLLAIARNLARDQLRRRRPTVSLNDTDGEQWDELASTPELPMMAIERKRLLHQALAGLPSHYQRAIRLRFFHGRDYATIGESMGISNGALRGILGRGMSMLRQRLKSRMD